MLNNKQLLILYLISYIPGIKYIDRLVRLLDRADFPAGIEIRKDLDILLKEKLIVTHENFDNDTPKSYTTTLEGITYLNHHFNKKEIIAYIKSMDNPDFMQELVTASFNKS